MGDASRRLYFLRGNSRTVTANKGSGSGFVISEDGTVVTAEHVVSGSKLVKVNLASGKECYGEVAAAIKQRGLAIIRRSTSSSWRCHSGCIRTDEGAREA